MTRQGSTKHKVVSSGRLTGLGRGQTTRKRVIGRTLRSSEPAYSLYSTDSEEPVATIHKGLDRCAALLDGILQAETTEANTSSATVRKAGLGQASRPLSTLGKQREDTERRKLTKKVKKPVPAPVQKTILSSRVKPGEKNNESRPGTRFNHRLTTSTPTLSPERLPSDGSASRAIRPPSVPPGQHRDPVHKGAPVLQRNAVLSSSRKAPAVSSASPTAPPALSTAPPASPTAPSASPTAPSACDAQLGCLGSEVGPPAAPVGVGLGCCPCLNAPCLGKPTLPTTPTSSCDTEVRKPCSLENGSGQQHQPHSQSKPSALPVPVCGAPLAALAQLPPHHGPCWACRGGAAGVSPGRTDEEGEDIVPTRDTSAQTSFLSPTPAAHTVANSCVTCTKPQSHLSSGPAQPTETHPEPPHPPQPLLCSEACRPEEAAEKVMTVHFLLGELRARLAGQDSTAERLLSDLEQTVSLLPVVVGSLNVQAEIAMVLQPLRNENAQLRRRVRILNHQLQERERAEREARSLLCDSEMMTLQVELSDAQARIQELYDDNAQLRQALQDTQSQLQNSKAEKDCISKEEHERRVEEYQREQAAVTLVVQQREAEIEQLQKLLRVVQDPVLELPPTNSRPPSQPLSQPGLTRQALNKHQDQQVSAGHGSDAVNLYLQSLGQEGRGSPPCQGPCQPGEQDLTTCVSANQSWGEGEEGETKNSQREDVRSALPVAISQKGGGAPAVAFTTGHRSLDRLLKVFNQSQELPSRLNQSNVSLPGVFPRGPLGLSAASELDFSVLSSQVQSVRSDCSVRSSSTFDTRDELEFRNGLAALDASIASLQKTIQKDLMK